MKGRLNVIRNNCKTNHCICESECKQGKGDISPWCYVKDPSCLDINGNLPTKSTDSSKYWGRCNQ
jgi:hypothetical protein